MQCTIIGVLLFELQFYIYVEFGSMFECCSLAEKARVMADNRWVLGIEVGHTRHAGKAQSPIYGARYQSAETDSTIILAHSQHTIPTPTHHQPSIT